MQRVGFFPNRPIAGEGPWTRLDATHVKPHEDGRIPSVAAIIAAGANAERRRADREGATARSRRSITPQTAHARRAPIDETEADVPAEMSFPTAHRGKPRSENPIERLDKGGQTARRRPRRLSRRRGERMPGRRHGAGAKRRTGGSALPFRDAGSHRSLERRKRRRGTRPGKAAPEQEHDSARFP
jgi:hypothetical protein